MKNTNSPDSIRLVANVIVVSRWLARLGGAVIVLCALLIATEVTLRNLAIPIKLNSFEVGIYGFAAALSFSFAHVLLVRGNIRIDLLYARLPLTVRALLDVAALQGMAVLAIAIAWHAWLVVGTSVRLGAVSNSTLQLPLAIPQGLWATGLSWFALVATLLLLRSLFLLVTGQFDDLCRIIGIPVAKSDRSE